MADRTSSCAESNVALPLAAFVRNVMASVSCSELFSIVFHFPDFPDFFGFVSWVLLCEKVFFFFVIYHMHVYSLMFSISYIFRLIDHQICSFMFRPWKPLTGSHSPLKN